MWVPKSVGRLGAHHMGRSDVHVEGQSETRALKGAIEKLALETNTGELLKVERYATGTFGM